MRFVVDMALSPKTVHLLRQSGHEAVRVNELNIEKPGDEGILEYAASNNMVVITADLDFGDILAHTKHGKPSVIIFRLRNPSPEHVNSLLSSSLSEIEESLVQGSIVVIEDHRIRVRDLPI